MEGRKRPFVLGFVTLIALLGVAAPADAGGPHDRYKKKPAKRTAKVLAPRKLPDKVVVSLPRNHVNIVVRGDPYFYASGIFYRKKPGGYMTVAAPVGARIAVLPAGYRRIVRNGVTFFLYYGTYYRFDPEQGDYVVINAPEHVLTKDVVFLVDGETMDGRMLKSNGEAIHFLMDGEIYEIPMSDVVAISFAPAAS